MKKTNCTFCFLYIFLFTGIFNDIIRVGTTQFTLFRFFLPIALAVTILKSPKARILYVMFISFAIISLLQSVVFCNFNSAGVIFSAARYFRYVYYYACIITIAGSVAYLRKSDFRFMSRFERILITSGILYLVLFMSIYHFDNIRNYLYINNQNDYGAMLTMLIPFFFYKYKNRPQIRIFFISLTVVYLTLNDCKLSLLGFVAEVALIIYFELRNKVKPTGKLLFVPSLMLVAIAFWFVSKSTFSFHGRTWQDAINHPLLAILNGELYNRSNTSVSFRVNSMIVSTQWMLKTGFLGIGIGNSGVLVRAVLGNQHLYDKWMQNDAVSLHNVFFEVGLEWGIFAIIALFVVIKKVIILLQKPRLSSSEICFIVTVLSSMFWLQAPSGILVDYLILLTFTFLVYQTNGQEKDWKVVFL